MHGFDAPWMITHKYPSPHTQIHTNMSENKNQSIPINANVLVNIGGKDVVCLKLQLPEAQTNHLPGSILW